MKFIITILLIFSVAQFGYTQSTYELDHHSELGFGLGAFNYTGDLAPQLSYKNFAPGGQVFYRYNDKREASVYRANISFGQMKASKLLYVPQNLDSTRVFEFSRTFFELAAIYEYNFFNFRDIKGIYFMSPYLFGGIATTVLFGEQSTAILSIPFGAGLKYKLTNNWNLGLEYGARATFYDRLDLLNEDVALSRSTPHDWYYFLNLNLSYTFYKQKCPTCAPKM